MTEKQYDLRAGYYYEYTGICSDTDENLTTNEVVDLLNKQEKRINQLENYIKSNFIGSVCDNCKHVKAYRTSNWFCGVDEDIECLKGHEDMDIDDCIDFEIDLGRYE